MHDSRLDLRTLLAYACIYVVWGTTYLGISLSIRTLPPFTSGAMRFLIAAALLYGWLRLRAPRPLAGLPLRWVVVSGILFGGVGNGFVIWAQQGVPTGIAALVVASLPVIVLLLDWRFFSRRAPTWRAIGGVTIALAGIAIIVSQTRSFDGDTGLLYFGAILVAITCWAVGTLLQRNYTLGEKVLGFTCAQMFASGLCQAGLALVTGEWHGFDPAQVSVVSLLAVLYLAVFGSIVSLNCFLWLLSHQPAQKVATYALVNPVVALVLGALVLGEPLTVLTVAAGLIVLLGVALVLFPTLRLPRFTAPAGGAAGVAGVVADAEVRDSPGR